MEKFSQNLRDVFRKKNDLEIGVSEIIQYYTPKDVQDYILFLEDRLYKQTKSISNISENITKFMEGFNANKL
jgi:hypothetical protein